VRVSGSDVVSAFSLETSAIIEDLERTERVDGLPNDVAALKAMIEDRMPAPRMRARA